MHRRVGAFFLLPILCAPLQPAFATSLPEIISGPNNKVPACVTPGRLMEYLKSRNPELDARYESIATEYMRYGEKLGLRWDYAFFQMIIETGSLSYRRGHRAGDVRPSQNNFAGLGATGNGEHGESFKDIASGVRAHLEHVLHYAGRKIENPVAERTRKVQEWGVLAEWHQNINRPITYKDLAGKWAPGTRSYRSMLEAVAERFEDFCRRPDPHPEYIQEARRSGPEPERPSGADLARNAIESGKAHNENQRAALGAPQQAANPPEQSGLAAEGIRTQSIDRAAKADTKPKAPTAAGQANQPAMLMASAGGAAKALAAPQQPPARKCRVWTASYGGQKAMIIKSVADEIINYTVLDVNEGAEAREAEAFIAAYAKNGSIAGEFGSQSQALDKAFELCPEG